MDGWHGWMMVCWKSNTLWLWGLYGYKTSFIHHQTVYAQGKHKDQKVVDMKAGKPNREENEGTAIDSLQQISCCQACQQDWDNLLILPCSHTLCVQCISAGEAGTSSKSQLSAVCAVACPSCRHPVELPCWNWSSAASCLPKHPSVSRACVRKTTNIPRDPQQQVRGAVSVCHTITSKGFQFCPPGWMDFFFFNLEEHRFPGHGRDGSSEMFPW